MSSWRYEGSFSTNFPSLLGSKKVINVKDRKLTPLLRKRCRLCVYSIDSIAACEMLRFLSSSYQTSSRSSLGHQVAASRSWFLLNKNRTSSSFQHQDQERPFAKSTVKITFKSKSSGTMLWQKIILHLIPMPALTAESRNEWCPCFAGINRFEHRVQVLLTLPFHNNLRISRFLFSFEPEPARFLEKTTTLWSGSYTEGQPKCRAEPAKLNVSFVQGGDSIEALHSLIETSQLSPRWNHLKRMCL